MSIITQKLPKTVNIGGKEYPIKTDFRDWIQFENILSDPKESEQEKIKCLLLLYSTLPPKFIDAWKSVMWFYSGAEHARENENTADQKQKSRSRIYHYEYDADYIYSAFWAQYGIDLQCANLHWWQFKALFKGLDETNMIVKIMGYRSMDLSQIKDKEQKRFYRKMKRLYRLPDMRTEQQREQDMVNSLSSVF